MTEQAWKNQCAMRLVAMYGYGSTDAREMADDLAEKQRALFGDVGRWEAAFAAADDVGERG